MITTVKCPNCGRTVEISEALRHELEEGAVRDEREKHKLELVEVKKQEEKRVYEKLNEQFELQVKTAKDDLEEAKKRNSGLIEQLTEMNKLIRDLKRKDEERAFEMEKKLSENEEKIRIDARKKAEEEQHLKFLELEKQKQDALRANEELRRKLEQGSQQTQGEVLELELENILKKEFPNDNVSPVGKGVRGADIIQEVWDRNGVRCGLILWESKNAKWNDNWIEKLKEDQRQLKAETAVLISEFLPKEVESVIYRDGVWLAQRKFVIGIAMALRASVIQVYHVRRSMTGKNEKMEVLYNYLSGVEFKHRVEAIIDAFTLMQEELEREKRWFSAKWARQEKQIRSVIDHTHGMHGDLKGIMGATLPEIKSLNGPDGQNKLDI